MLKRFTPIVAVCALACSGTQTNNDVAKTDEQATAKPAAPTVNADIFKPALADLATQERDAQQEAIVDLGRHLYYENRLSSNDAISCNSCHLLDQYGVDGVDFSKGVPGTPVGRNSPTVYNAFMHMTQFWDGRAADVEEQAKGPILAGKEMGMPDADAVVAKLKGISEYPPLFAKAFPNDGDPLTYDNVGKAIGAFERNLTTPSRFDDYLNGKGDALTSAELEGLTTFMESGCITCHSGTLLGGSMYQKVGLVEPWPNQNDLGRFALTNNEEDKMMFKVPSLRNIEKTAPYFHDSSANTLEEAVTMMGKHQLGKDLTAEETGAIVTFLTSLTGELPADYIKQRPLQ